jgi:hypothetical protein
MVYPNQEYPNRCYPTDDFLNRESEHPMLERFLNRESEHPMLERFLNREGEVDDQTVHWDRN